MIPSLAILAGWSLVTLGIALLTGQHAAVWSISGGVLLLGWYGIPAFVAEVRKRRAETEGGDGATSKAR